MSLLLAIDRSTAIASAALFRDGAFVHAATATSRARGDCDVATLAASALEGSGAGFADIDAFACGLGPGSFSGVRSALAFLDGLALPAGAEVVGIASSAAIAWAHFRDAAPGSAAFVVGDARRGTLWLARYERADAATLRETDAPVALPVADALARLSADPGAAVLSPDADRLAAAQLLFSQPPSERGVAPTGPGGVLRASPSAANSDAFPLAAAVGELALDPAAPRVSPPLPLYLHPAVAS